jgi:hypothetical protein
MLGSKPSFRKMGVKKLKMKQLSNNKLAWRWQVYFLQT